MITVLVTGSAGFLGSNLIQALSVLKEVAVRQYDVKHSEIDLDAALRQADLVFHLAGTNRPQRVEEYDEGNRGFTQHLCSRLMDLGRKPKIVMASSIQATQDNPYGISKLHAEDALREYADASGACVVVHRLKNLFGKWSRPNYNSVVATFCHNLTHGLPIEIREPEREIELVYVDDVVQAFLSELAKDTHNGGFHVAPAIPGTVVTVGRLADLIESFGASRRTCMLPDLSYPFIRRLYATYTSFEDTACLSYSLTQRVDNRGALAEFIKSSASGQVFVSATKPGITRGNHYHRTKTEKFLVLQGTGSIGLRHMGTGETARLTVKGEEFTVVDIPPGYGHCITNVGTSDMVVLFWSDEVFDPDNPDTYPCEVWR